MCEIHHRSCSNTKAAIISPVTQVQIHYGQKQHQKPQHELQQNSYHRRSHIKRMTNNSNTLKNYTSVDISVSKYHHRNYHYNHHSHHNQHQQQLEIKRNQQHQHRHKIHKQSVKAKSIASRIKLVTEAETKREREAVIQKEHKNVGEAEFVIAATECRDISMTICELASPRCQSRESNNSTLQNLEGRCSSNESQWSTNDGNNMINQMPLTPTTPPVALPLSATAGATALLPPQSAAMAAYLNVAAAAAVQQNHLLLTNPLAAAASLVQQATQQQVSNVHSLHDNSRQSALAMSSAVEITESAALDFSKKNQRHCDQHRRSGQEGNNDNEGNGNGVGDDDDDNGDGEGNDNDVNDSDNRNDNDDERYCCSNNDGDVEGANSPLDLSFNTGRHKRQMFDNDHEEGVGEESSMMTPTAIKMIRSNDYKSLTLANSSTWMPPLNPYLAAVAAASGMTSTNKSTLNNNNHKLEWDYKMKITPNEATKALEKMTEMTRIAATANEVDLIKTRHLTATTFNNSSTSTTVTATAAAATTASISTTSTSGATTNGRHSAWQSHWLNKGADAVRDVFKCVWCKQSFATLASLTTHMKETQHCGVNVTSSMNSNSSSHNNSSHSSNNSNSNNHHQLTQSNHSSHRHSISTQGNSNSINGNGNNNNSNVNSTGTAIGNGVGLSKTGVNNNNNNNSITSGSKSDLNMLIKETMPLPRKLVRGQDVWLGKGAEQTRQILKCMWCGQSFRSLAEMTAHMQETQHYTNIISQEQIISWKSSDDKPSRDRDRDNSALKGGNSITSPNTITPTLTTNPAVSIGNNSTLCAVLTCKVCEQVFSTLKDLSNHMIKNNHYKEHMIRAGGGSGGQQMGDPMPMMIRSGVGAGSGTGRGRQAKEKRKKSLPVRKLLEMERAQQDFKTVSSLDQALKPLRDFAASTKITCEKCNEKIETALFVDHIRQCIGGSIMMSPRSSNKYHNNNSNHQNNNNRSNSNHISNNNNHQQRHNIKSNYRHNNTTINNNVISSPRTPPGRKNLENSRLPSPIGGAHSEILYPLPVDNEKPTESSSVLSALEQLIEKSFDTRPRLGMGNAYDNNSTNTTPLGASILKRLGIDDAVDYTKPLMDPQTMQFLRSYSNYPSSSSIRDRSASESSSISERGGGVGGGSSTRLDVFTPDTLKNEYSSRQTTPGLTPEKLTPSNRDRLDYVQIKSEPMEAIERNTDDRSRDQDIERDDVIINDLNQKISVKKEFSMMIDDDVMSTQNNNMKDCVNDHGRSLGVTLGQDHVNNINLHMMHTHNVSPSLSDRSLTPMSTTSSLNEKKELSFQMPATITSSSTTAVSLMSSATLTTGTSSTTTTTNEGGSLSALSSMFNNLNNCINSNNTSIINSAALDSITSNNHCGRNGGESSSGSDKSGSATGNCHNNYKKTNVNPLAALQKLCETTDTPPAANTRSSTNSNNNNSHLLTKTANISQQLPQQLQQTSSSSLQIVSTSSSSSSNSSGGSSSATGSVNIGNGSFNNTSMLTFGWANSNTHQHSSDTLIKCSFCDIPFNSKGAYRHHLSKIHFVKELDAGDINPNINNGGSNSSSGSSINLKSPPVINSPKSLQPSPNRNAIISALGKNKSPISQRLEPLRLSITTTATTTIATASNTSNNSTTPTINPYDESSQAKFLKYAALAKQLSSKNS